MRRVVNVHEAKSQLSRLIAAVEAGEEVVIARDGVPVADLVRHSASAGRTSIGIDDALLERARAAAGLPNGRQAVEKGLETLVRLGEQKAILDLAGKVEFFPEVIEERAAVRRARRRGGA